MINFAKIKEIVIVDDSKTNSYLLKKILEAEGFYVDEINTSTDAIERIKKTLPDLIILDIMMPDKSGLQILDEIKSIPALRNIPVIMYSALYEEEVKEEAKAKGAFSFITKPTTRKDIMHELISLNAMI